jgi:hypothetical protein
MVILRCFGVKTQSASFLLQGDVEFFLFLMAAQVQMLDFKWFSTVKYFLKNLRRAAYNSSFGEKMLKTTKNFPLVGVSTVN